MKVLAINYQNQRLKPQSIALENNTADFSQNQNSKPTNYMSFEGVNPALVQYYNYKLNQDGKLFDNKQELLPLSKNEKPSPISFGAEISEDDKLGCHLRIHAASAACGAVSSLLGEGAAVGMDTWFLRGIQAWMFFSLQDLLDIEIPASLLYIGTQYSQATYIGVRAAEQILSWLGIGGHAVSLGSASAPISAGVRAVNGSLSTLITEKMGWGYVKSYERDMMNFKTQAVSTLIYAATMGILNHHNSHLDPSSFTDIQTAVTDIPKEHLPFIGEAMQHLTDAVNLPRAGIMFSATLLRSAICASKMSEADAKEYIKNSIKIAMLNTILYEFINVPGEKAIENDAMATIASVRKELESDNEIFSEFTKYHQKIVDDIDLDKLSTRDFIKKFSDKQFMANLAFVTSDVTNIIADKIQKRNSALLRKPKPPTKVIPPPVTGSDITSRFTPEQIAEMEKAANSVYQGALNNLLKKARANHGLDKIAGYDQTKVLLTLTYIEPVKEKREDSVPNAILFYGPSGSGKTVIGHALAQDSGARVVIKNLGMGDERKTLNWLKKQLEIAGNSNRYSIIQLNEFDEFLNEDSELREEFLDMVKDCGKKYHTTLFLTTNNPLNINKDILEKIDVRIPMGPAQKKDIHDITEYYIGDRPVENLNLDEITDEFESVKPDFAYSNAQIENIIDKQLPKENCTQQNILDIIKKVKPCINKETLAKFDEEQKIIGVGGKN